jgi:hypothetical protein
MLNVGGMPTHVHLYAFATRDACVSHRVRGTRSWWRAGCPIRAAALGWGYRVGGAYTGRLTHVEKTPKTHIKTHYTHVNEKMKIFSPAWVGGPRIL